MKTLELDGKRFGKRREAMTVAELERVTLWLGENYRIPERREPGVVYQPVGRQA